jgi:hypothetical protein
MRIEVEKNANCAASEEFEFRELSKPRPIRAIRVEESGKEVICDVTGVERGGKFGPAMAVKVTDSGEGFAFLIYGGAWGLRLKPASLAASWDLADRRQWGEPFKLYGSEDDIIYE